MRRWVWLAMLAMIMLGACSNDGGGESRTAGRVKDAQAQVRQLEERVDDLQGQLAGALDELENMRFDVDYAVETAENAQSSADEACDVAGC